MPPHYRRHASAQRLSVCRESQGVLGGLAQGVIGRARAMPRRRDDRRGFVERQQLLSTLRREEPATTLQAGRRFTIAGPPVVVTPAG
jgi:hypothetical protein